MTKIDHKGRLSGWTENQVIAFWRVTKARQLRQQAINNRVRNTLLRRNVIMRLNGSLMLTEYGEAVARSCGWIPPLRTTGNS